LQSLPHAGARTMHYGLSPASSSDSRARRDAAPRTHDFDRRQPVQGLPVHELAGKYTRVRRSFHRGNARSRRRIDGTSPESDHEKSRNDKQCTCAGALETKFAWIHGMSVARGSVPSPSQRAATTQERGAGLSAASASCQARANSACTCCASAPRFCAATAPCRPRSAQPLLGWTARSARNAASASG
jgi:hypothetical protein